MAASKEKRVRVEFFWKIIARVRSEAGASGSTRPWVQPRRAALRAAASSRMARRSAPESRQRSTKCLTGWVIGGIPNTPLIPAAGTQIHLARAEGFTWVPAFAGMSG